MNKIIRSTFTLAIFFCLAITHTSQAQSQLYLGLHTDAGWLQSNSYNNNVLSGKGLSPHGGVGLSFFYRWKEFIAIEGGVSQQSSKLKLRDQSFEAANDRFEVIYSNNNNSYNYYGALRLMAPLGNETYLYGQFTYANNVVGATSLSETEEFVLSSSGVNQTINTNVNYNQSNISYTPELGFQTKTANGNMWSFGLKMNLGQSEVLNGTYTITDNADGTIVSDETFSSKGNFMAFNIKYSILLKEWEKKDRVKKITVCHNGEELKIDPAHLQLHLGHGDKQGSCGDKVTLCHRGTTIEVLPENVDAHLAHGDTEGECPKPEKKKKEKKKKEPKPPKEKKKKEKKEKEKKDKEPKQEMVTLCHRGTTIEVPEKDVPAHLAHGDTKGECPKKPKEDDLKVDKDGIPKTLKDRKVEKEKTVYVKSTNIVFKVWDSGKEVDGDSISLNLNGQWVAEDIGLTRDKREIKVTIKDSGKNFLMMYALNLGKYPPNTAAISVWDGDREQKLELKSDLETCGALNIVFRP